MTQSPLRIGFLGAGLIATFHSKSIRAAQRTLGFEIVRAGVYDPDTARRDAFAEASSHIPMDDEVSVIESCDAVYVCTWTSEHRRLVDMVARAGKAVFCEKPLATSLHDARRIVNIVESTGVVNQVGLILRRSPAYLMARELINDPAAGRVMTVVFRDDQFIPTQGHYASKWRADAGKAGAGTLIEHSIHDIDMLHALVGPIRSVSARRSNFHGHEGIEDVMSSTFSFANESGESNPAESTGVLTSVWHDNLARPSLRRVEVFCERRHVVIDGDDWLGPVSHTDADGRTASYSGDQLLAMTSGLADDANPDAAFLVAAHAGTPASPDCRVALAAHEVVDAMYRSADRDGASIIVRPKVDQLSIRRATTAEVRPLRLEVLRRDMADKTVAFDGDDDAGTTHLVAQTSDGEIVGVSTWLRRPCPLNDEATAWQLRGMATINSLQGSGIGTRLLLAGFDTARANGSRLVWANARDAALDFYVRNGMTVRGDGFIEKVTQLPHHVVVIDL